jgi:hypothetical protein
MRTKKKTSISRVAPSMDNILKDISKWEKRLFKKEKEDSELSIQVEDIKIALNLFLNEYNARVGLLYVRLDKVKLRIKEYEYRINATQNKGLSLEDLNAIEDEVGKRFSKQREKINDLERETYGSSEEHKIHLKEEEGQQRNIEFEKELKTMYRKLALKYHPDLAKDEIQKKDFHLIMSRINTAYKNNDLETLRKDMQQVEREEKIAKETPEEKLSRLKEEYEIVTNIVAKLKAELNDFKSNETYIFKEKVESAKIEGRDLLEELANSIKEEITENEKTLEELLAQYKNVMGSEALK